MKTFSLQIQSTSQYEQIDNVISFIGEDASGSFGIFANHARIMTCLKFGLAKIKIKKQEEIEEEYLALPGGVLYFAENTLSITTRHYLRSKDYDEITTSLDEKLRIEEENITNIKETLHRFDEKVFKRLWEMKHGSKT